MRALVDLHLVAIDRRQRHPQVGDRTAGRHQAGQHCPLDHARGGMGISARDHARAFGQHRAEGGAQPRSHIRSDVDVDQPRHAVATEDGGDSARLPDQVGADRRSGLDCLERVDLHARAEHGLLADRTLVADRHAVVQHRMGAHIHPPSQDGTLDARAATDVIARVEHAAGDHRPLLDDHVVAQKRVRPHPRPGFDLAVIADVGGSFDLVELGQLDTLAQEHVRPQPDARERQLHLALERVEVGLAELVEIADVLPVALGDVAVHRLALLQQHREQLLGEVIRLALGNRLQHLGLQHVHAGVDGVREHLPPRRLLEEPFDAAVGVDDHDPELERVLNRTQCDGGDRAPLAMPADQLGQVEVAQRIAGDDQERVVQELLGVLDAAGGSQRRLLHRVVQIHPQRLAVTEVPADHLRQVGDGDHDLVHAVLAQQLDDVLHARLSCHRHHRLGLVGGQRPQPRPLPTRHHDGFDERLPSVRNRSR